MEVEYVQTLQDLIALNIYHQKCQPWWRRHLFWGSVGLALVTLGVGAKLSHSLSSMLGSADNLFAAGVIGAGLGVWFWFACDWKRRAVLRARHAAKRPENKRMLGRRKCSLTPEGLTTTTDDSSSTFSWTGVGKIALTDEHAFFYVTPLTAVLVPRRAFATEQDFLGFVETARAYWDAAREADTNITPDECADR